MTITDAVEVVWTLAFLYIAKESGALRRERREDKADLGDTNGLLRIAAHANTRVADALFAIALACLSTGVISLLAPAGTTVRGIIGPILVFGVAFPIAMLVRGIRADRSAMLLYTDPPAAPRRRHSDTVNRGSA